MLLPKTIPIDGIQTPSNVRYEPNPVDSSYADEVIDLVEEQVARCTPTLPRPVLPSRVAMIGNYLPRKCGIATFTTDLCDAIHAEYRATELLALPVNDTDEGYSYPARVRFELSQTCTIHVDPATANAAEQGRHDWELSSSPSRKKASIPLPGSHWRGPDAG